ncbi:MAG TPA: Rieske 2Fe-2S domain-containing protein, partial [Pirellulales bacterium]|nr:Rieske 2Fe-2S domain-containing protein [Pirellulales bacterium]
ATRYGSWLTGSEVADVEQIPRGGGAVIRRGVQKIAVYRDTRGTLHEMSASCPHLGCLVEFNSDEKTWDCGCHGSRFDCMGRVLNGPSNADLSPAEEPSPAKG